MVAVRSNFFYTRTVPCELWFLNRGKPAGQRGQVLMIDARGIYRQVTRKIYDFSPEQEQNLLAIVWLYRGRRDQFLALVADYRQRTLAAAAACLENSSSLGPASDRGPLPAFLASPADLTAAAASLENSSSLGPVSDRGPLPAFLASPADLTAAAASLENSSSLGPVSDRGPLPAFLASLADLAAATASQSLDEPAAAALAELAAAQALFEADVSAFRQALAEQQAAWPAQQSDNEALKGAVARLAGLAERSRDLARQSDLLYKLAARLVELCEGAGRAAGNGRALNRLRRAADEARQATVEQLRQVRYFWRQAHWLVERFPEAELRDVPELVRVVSVTEIAANDWSLTPGRYVGVAPAEEDEDFDFEETLREIHGELEELNAEAVELAARIQRNFEELGI